MRLLFDPPPQLKDELADATYIIPFDRDPDGNPAEGILAVKNNVVKTYVNNVLIQEVPIEKLSEVKIYLGVGCAELSAASEDGKEPYLLARFTQTHTERMAELGRAIRIYNNTGHYIESDNQNERICFTCGNRMAHGTSVCPYCTKKSSVFTRYVQIAKPYIGKFVLVTTLLLVASLAGILIPVFNKNLVDDHLVPQQGPVGRALLWVGLILACHLVSTFVSMYANRKSVWLGNRLSNDLRTLAYSRVQALSINSMSKRTPGDLMNRITSDTSVIQSFISYVGQTVFLQVVSIVVVTTIMLFTNWKLTLWAYLPVPLTVVVIRWFWRTIHLKFSRQWRWGSRANSILHDIIRGIRVVKSFGNEKIEIEKFQRVSKKLADVSEENEKLWATLSPLLAFVIGCGEFLVLYFGGQDVLHLYDVGKGGLTVGELIQFMSFLGYIYGPLQTLSRFPQQLANFFTSSAKLFEILDEEQDVPDKEEAEDIEIKGRITFDEVHFGYNSYEPVIKGVSFEIQPGEMIGIVGPSGVGKSTLINLILRFYDVTSGRLLIDGHDIRDISQRTLRQSIGVVFQETFLFAGTIYENIAYAKPDATPEEVFAATKIANAHEFIIKLPDGYNTRIGENGFTLSGGERQRIAIARAVLRNPAILILDEATASLDTETEHLIQEALERLIQGRTTVAIAHRLSTLRHADRLVCLDKGRIAEIGSHDELMEKQGVYYRLVMAQRQTSKLADMEEELASAK